jgi:polar amino acid transport system permease protein
VVVPPLGNQINAMFKTTSLLSMIAVPELFHVADAIHAATYRTFEVYLGVSVYYLALTALWTVLQRWIEARLKIEFLSDSSEKKATVVRRPTHERAESMSLTIGDGG